MDLGPIQISRKTGQEKFLSSSGEIDTNLLEFWRWSTSDLLSNSTRGRLAEFLVAAALGVAGHVRNEWDPFDLTDQEGSRIEIKTSAYIQSWHQDRLSSISFDIKPSRYWNSKTNKLEEEIKRQSDFYIFCLLHHTDKKTVDPLNLDQWTFYILPTVILNNKLPNQKRISLEPLLKLNPVKCSFGQIREELRKLKWK